VRARRPTRPGIAGRLRCQALRWREVGVDRNFGSVPIGMFSSRAIAITAGANDPFPPLAKGGQGGWRGGRWTSKTTLPAKGERRRWTTKGQSIGMTKRLIAPRPPPLPPPLQGGETAQRIRGERATCGRSTFLQATPRLHRVNESHRVESRIMMIPCMLSTR
jgi:hypothetical protein